MITRTRLAAGLAMTAVAVTPVAAAEAKPVAPKKVTKQVNKQVRAAKVALGDVTDLIAAGNDRAAAKRARAVTRHIGRAQRVSKRIGRRANTRRYAKTYAKSISTIGVVASTCAEKLSASVGDVAPGSAVDIAGIIEACLVDREQAIEVLTSLLDEVPSFAKPYVGKAIAVLSGDGQSVFGDLTQVLQNPALPPQVAEALGGALDQATSIITMIQEKLGGIAAMVPAPAKPYVEQALSIVTQQLTFVQNLLGSLLGGGPADPGAPVGDEDAEGGGFAFPGLNILDEILGGLFGGFGGFGLR